MATKQIFVNLPVKNLEKSKAFFAALGYTFNEQFTDANAACMVINEGSIHAMLLVEDFFKTFTDKSLTDTSKSTEVLLCLSCESRAEVDELVAKAVAAGGTVPRAPQDYGFMYGHGFQDLDGHLWELSYMDPNAEVSHQNP
ncbi:VOC family protein [Variovorax paradoxus]|uniref:VOC family protein n=1 Tax=Variovorax paradoxus TaxID=34073 RepID=UPI003D65F622